MSPVPVAVAGATGRMGGRVARAVEADEGFRLAACPRCQLSTGRRTTSSNK